MVTAETTTVGLKEPVESRLNGTPGAYSPKIDGSAVRAVRVEQAHGGADHDPAPALTRCFARETCRSCRLSNLLFIRVRQPHLRFLAVAVRGRLCDPGSAPPDPAFPLGAAEILLF